MNQLFSQSIRENLVCKAISRTAKNRQKKKKKRKEKKEAKKNRGGAGGGGGENENNEVPDRDDLNYIN